MNKPSISLCMIVRNEEEYLPKCLSSVQRIVDEIIVVDTGSTDDTVAMAKAFEAKVIQMPWQDSFADARNRGLDEATGDWILWLDADEEMDVAEGDKLKELLTRDVVHEQGIEGFQFIICNHLEGGGVEHICLTRMVRNRQEYRFEGRIHEQILPNMLKLNPNMKLGQVDIHIHHYGYLAENIFRQDKIGRNITLLRQAMVEHPNDPYYWFYLGVELYRINDLEGALRHFHAFLNSGVHIAKSMEARAHKYSLIILKFMGHYEDLVRHSEKSIEQFPGYTDLYHLMASGYHALGKTDRAMDSLRKALRMGPVEQEYPSIEGHGSYLTCRDLGLLYQFAGNAKDADLYFTLASIMVGDVRVKFVPPGVRDIWSG
ncbi:glycosyltransferase family 2 protein [Paenibacillus jiagnxiensis]|uniref:glycosyltransferase family 2 protein n=1 Tax=Paenibacillus jiagnxiensis TaxID=3228926 RepID=UPI0033AF0952